MSVYCFLYPSITRKWKRHSNTLYKFAPLGSCLAVTFAAGSEPPSRDNHCKAPYPRIQQCDLDVR